MQMQQDELQQLQERIAQLEQKNAALQAEVANLGQRELALQAQEKAARHRATELIMLNAGLQAEIRLCQQTQNVLRESECRFRKAFEQAAIGMALTDIEGHLLQSNQRFCEMIGYTESELRALNFADITHPDTLADNRALMQSLINCESAYHTEKRYLRKDGSWFWACLSLSLVRDAAGNPAYLIAVVQDISQRKEAESIAQGQQMALQGTLALLASEPELDKFLNQVLITIAEQLQAPVADIWLQDTEQATIALHLTQRNVQLAPEPLTPFNPSPISLSTLEGNLARKTMTKDYQPFVYSDLPNHPDMEIFRACSAVRDGVQTLLTVPLVFGKEYLGSLAISHMQSHSYSPEAVRLATALAQQIVLATQLTRLAQEAKQVALMEEHNRLAREIHDTLAQTFTGISLQLNNAQYYATVDAAIAWDIIEQVKTLAQSGLAESRRFVWSLHPDADEYRDLAGLLERSLTQLTLHTSVQTDFVIVGEPVLVPPDIGMNLLRIAQEAITNALRHAQAQTLQIELNFQIDVIALRIRDDGQGFDPQSAGDCGGFGLLGMQQRCDRLGGQFTLCSQPGLGTSILIQILLTSPLV